ncbi:MAG: hypothetical protein IJX17_07550 [Clostridia bacterium]|nr:hypothetical protein [Clostridia bacterium]
MKNEILLKRNYLLYDKNIKSKNFAHFAVKLLDSYAVEVDKPEFLTEEHIKLISEFYEDNIPESFYQNPQDLNNFTCDELYIEQLVSYFTIDINGTFTTDKEVYKRKEIFSKVFPSYFEGDELKIRLYTMINEDEATKILNDVMISFCKYTRPWSDAEFYDFMWLFMNGYYKGEPVLCKDNLITILFNFKAMEFAKYLDKKDIVKMSRQRYGDKSYFTIDKGDAIIFKIAIESCKDCPLSKKQAKYFNIIAKKCGAKVEKQTNEKSPYKYAKKLIKDGKVYEAALVFAENGSLLERNIVWLLSRASIEELPKILDLIKFSNPIVLMQLLQKIIEDNGTTCRTFVFSFNSRVKVHYETEEEHKVRKSILSIGVKTALINTLKDKIESYYKSMPNLGKIYISDEFKKVAVPFNTSAMGRGLDVLPTGSRLPISGEYIRAFCYWNNAFDIDASIAFIDKDNNNHNLNWTNYTRKMFDNDALHSGDVRGKDGSEFIDLNIEGLKNRGIKYAIFILNGYGDNLNTGKIYCGYQNKNNIETKAWSPKNIELKIHVEGDSRFYAGFAIDFEKNEIIILNQISASDNRVISRGDYEAYMIYLKPSLLEFVNLYNILSIRGELVNTPEEADYVFDNRFVSSSDNENQQIIKATQIEKLVSLLK